MAHKHSIERQNIDSLEKVCDEIMIKMSMRARKLSRQTTWTQVVCRLLNDIN